MKWSCCFGLIGCGSEPFSWDRGEEGGGGGGKTGTVFWDGFLLRGGFGISVGEYWALVN